MSGKAPPKGPRALLGSLPVSSVSTSASSGGQSAPQQPTPTAAQAPVQRSPTIPLTSPSKRIGTAPPTGPRSLTNGSYTSPHTSPSFRGGAGGKPKHFVNGHINSNPGNPTTVGLGSNTLQNRHAVKGQKSESGSGWTSASGVNYTFHFTNGGIS
jgi:hypothetical protein